MDQHINTVAVKGEWDSVKTKDDSRQKNPAATEQTDAQLLQKFRGYELSTEMKTTPGPLL